MKCITAGRITIMMKTTNNRPSRPVFRLFTTVSSLYQGMLVSKICSGSNLACTTVTTSPRASLKPTTPRTKLCMRVISSSLYGLGLGSIGSPFSFFVKGPRSLITTATLKRSTVPVAALTWRTERSSSKLRVLRLAVVFLSPVALGPVAVVLLFAVGATGGVLDKAPGIPLASFKVFLSSLKASERVLGPSLRLSKSSVVVSVCVKSSDMFTCERTLASPTIGARICDTRWRYTSSNFCLCCVCAEVKPSAVSDVVSVISLPWLSTTVTFSVLINGTLEATR